MPRTRENLPGEFQIMTDLDHALIFKKRPRTSSARAPEI